MMRRRGGPGLLSTVARTAVIAGTATAVSNKVHQAGAAKAAAAQQAQAATAPPPAPVAAPASPPPMAAAPAGGTGDLIERLQQLAVMRESGLLTDEEFSQAKARLLAG